MWLYNNPNPYDMTNNFCYHQHPRTKVCHHHHHHHLYHHQTDRKQQTDRHREKREEEEIMNVRIITFIFVLIFKVSQSDSCPQTAGDVRHSVKLSNNLMMITSRCGSTQLL